MWSVLGEGINFWMKMSTFQIVLNLHHHCETEKKIKLSRNEHHEIYYNTRSAFTSKKNNSIQSFLFLHVISRYILYAIPGNTNIRYDKSWFSNPKK